MKSIEGITLSYFPGCSLATTAKENNQSLIEFCGQSKIDLVELDDWNCCGSSSAHSINPELAIHLASRNLSLASPDKPLLIACPGCYLRLRQTQIHLQQDENLQQEYQKLWDIPFNPGLKILHFFDLLNMMMPFGKHNEYAGRLKGLRFAPYYGCMLSRPPCMNREKRFHGIMESTMSALGASPVRWPFAARCCGTFLTVARPDIVTPMVNAICRGAMDSDAECIVTACAMCHLNLEIRCTLKKKLPVFHFSELLSLAFGVKANNNWFSRHLVDPLPLLSSREIL